MNSIFENSSKAEAEIAAWKNELFLLIEKNEVESALDVSSKIELSLCENMIVSAEENADFFFVFLLLNMINKDHLEARNLWYRIPEQFKTRIFQDLWCVLKFLWNLEIRSALQLLSSTDKWPEQHKALIINLIKVIRRYHSELLSRAYRSMSLDELSSNLYATSDDALLICHQYGWHISNAIPVDTSSMETSTATVRWVTFTPLLRSSSSAANITYPSSFLAAVTSASDTNQAVSKFQELTNLFLILETKSLEVNLSKKDNTPCVDSSNTTVNKF